MRLLTSNSEGVCLYNKEVNCTEKNCKKCGWNPEVEKIRKIKIWKAIKEET